MTTYAYLFEAKSIQSYILDSGRMRDLVGASELVDSLTENLLRETLNALGFEKEEPICFSRRAGGALYAFAEDKAKLDDFAALWSLAVAQYAPGMNFDVGRGEGPDAHEAFNDARTAIREDASRIRPNLPVTAPIAERSRRTGNPAVSMDGKDGGSMDRPTHRKKAFADASRAGLTDRFSPDDAKLAWRDWPRDLTPGAKDAFPFLGDDHTVALIHADGNGMGELLRRAGEATRSRPETFVGLFRKLSEAIADITQAAARHATATVLIPERDARRDHPRQPDPEARLAARPIVLGGDDLTILVRADLALDFLKAFLEKFEEESRPRLEPLELEGIDGLTAGAGVVFLRASQPFYLAAHLAESLAKLAKDRAKAQDAKRPPSTVAFHRVTQSMIEDYPEIVSREKTVSIDGTDHINTLGAYALRAGHGIPTLDDLFRLTGLLQADDMSRGPTRQLQTLVGLAPNQAETAYRRWRELMKDNKQERLTDFDRTMKALLPNYKNATSLPYADDGMGRQRTPLGDALTLMSVTKAQNTHTDQEDAA